jgi:hypothetical protein
VTIVVTTVASDFFSDEIGLFERIVLASKLYFCHHQPVVIAMKHIDFPCVLAIRTFY